MDANVVVMTTLAFNQHTGFFKGVEDFTIEKLITELAIEGFRVAALPRTARFNVRSLYTDFPEPFKPGDLEL